VKTSGQDPIFNRAKRYVDHGIEKIRAACAALEGL
jgi:hypothetical protein